MKKGILVVSFGTSYEATRKKCIESIEKKIEESYSDYQVRRAFTSNMIIKKLKERDDIHVDTPLEALEKMVDSGMEEIYVQPLHIIPGYEYEKVRNAVIRMRHRTKVKISLGLPLLYEERHYDEVIDGLLNTLPEEKEHEGILLMGHGTEHFANACYSMLQNKIKDRRDDILLANVEGYPEIDHVIHKIENTYKKMTLIPLMMVAGDHAINDMAGEEDSYRTLLEEKHIQVNCLLKGLGEREEIQHIFVQRIAEMMG